MEIDEAQRLAVFQVWGVLGRFEPPTHRAGAPENRWQDDPRCVNPLDNKAGCEASKIVANFPTKNAESTLHYMVPFNGFQFTSLYGLSFGTLT